MSEAVRLRVRVLFEQAVAGGLAPNEAAAQALQTAQEEAFAQAAERRVAAVASELECVGVDSETARALSESTSGLITTALADAVEELVVDRRVRRLNLDLAVGEFECRTGDLLLVLSDRAGGFESEPPFELKEAHGPPVWFWGCTVLGFGVVRCARRTPSAAVHELFAKSSAFELALAIEDVYDASAAGIESRILGPKPWLRRPAS